jgi:hypothetical protein
MGPLKSMKYGALVKALYTFSKKHQNYGKLGFQLFFLKENRRGSPYYVLLEIE